MHKEFLWKFSNTSTFKSHFFWEIILHCLTEFPLWEFGEAHNMMPVTNIRVFQRETRADRAYCNADSLSWQHDVTNCKSYLKIEQNSEIGLQNVKRLGLLISRLKIWRSNGWKMILAHYSHYRKNIYDEWQKKNWSCSPTLTKYWAICNYILIIYSRKIRK